MVVVLSTIRTSHPCMRRVVTPLRMPLKYLRMTITLLESERIVPLRARLAYHGSVIGQLAAAFLAITVLSRVVVDLADAPVDRPTFLAPLYKDQPHPVQEQLSYVALGGVPVITKQPAVGTTPEQKEAPPSITPEPVGGGDARPPAEAKEDIDTRAFSEIEVDSAVVRDPNSEGPVYPAALLKKGVEGVTLVTFVVDSSGHPDVRSFLALMSTDSLFAIAVREALPRMKFAPAKRNGTPVRQLVEQKFTFRIPKPADTKGKRGEPSAAINGRA